ncbi:MAG: ABC transporter permease, partial [Thermoanaerobaculia bacterium]|nr:ABC transporter permease [Thermoanaerobaculia bacterium]
MRIPLEFRAAARRLLRRPAYAAAVVLTLALGLGATTALWSVVRSVLLDPLPLPESERLLFITRDGDVSIPDGVDWRAASPSFESIALFLRRWTLDYTGGGEPERLVASVAEPELFGVLRVEPLLGRVFGAADNVAGGARVAVLSESFWRRRFDADPQVVGRTITLSDRPTTILGVLPEAADFLDDDVALWVPAAVETPWAVDERGTNNFDAVGRLAPGATLETARAELRTVCERLAAEFPKTNASKIVVPISLLDFRVGKVRQALWILLAAVGLLLLLACLNTGGLLLARTLARRQELGVRAALGAGPRGLLSPLGAETALLYGAGGLA